MDAIRRKILGSLTWGALASLAAESRLLAARGSLAASGSQPEESVLTAEVLATLASLSDTILPQTLTPGALDVGVPRYIEFVFQRGLDAAARTAFLAGAAELQADAPRVLGIAFASAPADRRLSYIRALDAQCFSPRPPTSPALLAFVSAVKRLTIVGYYTSDTGSHSELDVELLPGPFRGDVRSAQLPRTYYEDSFGVPLERPPGYLSHS